MSVEKYIVNKESSNFTIIPNKVIQGLNSHLELLGFYLYLLSLPPQWSFHKTQLREVCKLGINKIDQFFKILHACELIKIIQHRDEKGRFSYFDLTVLNGESFNINGLSQCSHRSMKTIGTVAVAPSGEAIKETYKKEIKKKERERQKNLSQNNKSVDNLESSIKEDCETRLNVSDYKTKKYEFDQYELDLAVELKIINPYLVFEKYKVYLKTRGIKTFRKGDFHLWLMREKNHIGTQNGKKSEIRPTPKDWGKGHPTYDTLHGSSNLSKI